MLMNCVDSSSMLNQVQFQIKPVEISLSGLIHLKIYSFDVIAIIFHESIFGHLNRPQLREKCLPG